jgi:hypothetical protein
MNITFLYKYVKEYIYIILNVLSKFKQNFQFRRKKEIFLKKWIKFEDKNFGHESGTKNNMFFSKSEELNKKYTP